MAVHNFSNGLIESSQHRCMPAGLGVPNQNPPIVTRRGQVAAVGGKIDVADPIGVVCQFVEKRSRFKVPDA